MGSARSADTNGFPKILNPCRIRILWGNVEQTRFAPTIFLVLKPFFEKLRRRKDSNLREDCSPDILAGVPLSATQPRLHKNLQLIIKYTITLSKSIFLKLLFIDKEKLKIFYCIFMISNV